jgi:sugar phosphate isomerase/epimerase
MAAPVALQLHSVRDLLARDLEGTIRRVAEIGFLGVETAGFKGASVEAAAQQLRKLDLEVCAAHAPLPLGDEEAAVLERVSLLGSTRLVCPWQPKEFFLSPLGIEDMCGSLNDAAAVAREHGIRFGYHNHAVECLVLEGRPGYEHMLDFLDPGVFLEVDTYWAWVAGLDPAETVRRLSHRAPLLHLKDGPGVVDGANVPLGRGTMDIPAIVKAAGDSAEWLIVEFDHCEGDVMAAVAESYDFLVRRGLARGR